MSPNFEKLLKLLQLTTQEAQAPEAIKAANRLLTELKLNWADVLTAEAFEAPPTVSYAISDMLDVVLEEVSPTARSRGFIESLAGQYKAKNYLSPKQHDALRKFYDRCLGI